MGLGSVKSVFYYKFLGEILMEILYENIEALDGAIIRTAHFKAAAPVGVVQCIHGFGEGIEHYKQLAEYFTKQNLTCIIHDQRGFGKMPDLSQWAKRRARGVIPSYKHFLGDVHSVRKKIGEWYDLPVFLYGYSMGGNIGINFLLRGSGKYQELYKKAIFVAPWISTYRKVPRSAEKLAVFAGKVSPRIKVSSRLNPGSATVNKDEFYGLAYDEVYHDRISLRMYSQISRAGRYAIDNAHRLSLPALVVWAGEDKVVCNKAIQDFIYRAKGNVDAIEYPNAYHFIMIEGNKDDILDHITKFIKSE